MVYPYVNSKSPDRVFAIKAFAGYSILIFIEYQEEIKHFEKKVPGQYEKSW